MRFNEAPSDGAKQNERTKQRGAEVRGEERGGEKGG